MGNDRVFLVTGGKAHIGAIATAYFEEQNLFVKVQTIPGHREGPLAEELAKAAALAFRQSVTVIAGIHVDGATKKDIDLILQHARLAMKQEIDKGEVEDCHGTKG